MMGDSGDVTYPMYLLNGRPDNDPETFTAKPGERVRLRIINAGADTIFTVALADHRLRVTHTDGFPVRPVPTSAIRIGMGERYDAVVDVSDGAFALVAEPLGKSGLARAILRTSSSAPAPSTRTRRELIVTRCRSLRCRSANPPRYRLSNRTVSKTSPWRGPWRRMCGPSTAPRTNTPLR
jgi:FtsP/CotA-like multicopper oxidase with cupredoxin domain